MLEAVRNILVEPMPDDPLEQRIADEYRRDRAEFEKNARAYVDRYAKGSVNFSQVADPGEKSKDANDKNAAAGGGAAAAGRGQGGGAGAGAGSAARTAPPA